MTYDKDKPDKPELDKPAPQKPSKPKPAAPQKDVDPFDDDETWERINRILGDPPGTRDLATEVLKAFEARDSRPPAKAAPPQPVEPPKRSGGRPKKARDPRLIRLARSWRRDVLKFGEADSNVVRAHRIEARWRAKGHPMDGLMVYERGDDKNRGRLKPAFRAELDELMARHPDPPLY